MFRWILATSGFDVREAGDGYEALVLLEQHPPDLVVLDLGLPRVDGLSVQAEIAAQVLTRDIPVVIVTAAHLDLTHLDVACVLRKPVDADELLATVQRCLVSRSSAAAGASRERAGRDRVT
jgi:DNA-binding response OmpR family regulator